MKLPNFDYVRPSSLEEVMAILDKAEGEALLLSGGQSLIPILAFRLAAPQMLVDLAAIPGLDEITMGQDDIKLGARVRWCDIAASPLLRKHLPLLPAAVEHVAHYQIQNRGTIGGSLAHADPAAEFPGIAVACDASIEVTSSRGRREIAAADFFLGPLENCLEIGDVITAARFPLWRERRRWAFEEFSRRRGDFAISAIALHYDLDERALVRNAHIAVIGATDIPRRLPAAEAALNGAALDEEKIAAAAKAAMVEIRPSNDLHASADYRRALTETLVTRALRQTMTRDFA